MDNSFWIGLLAFALVGVFHPLVVAYEYYLGKERRWILLVVGGLSLVLSLFLKRWLSLCTGVFGAACLWSFLEVKWQYGRVCRGRGRKNPRRGANYYVKVNSHE